MGTRKAKAARKAALAARRAEAEREAEHARLWAIEQEADRRAAAPIMTIEGLIVALGGPYAVDDWLSDGAASRWLKNGWVCRGYNLQVYLALTHLGHRHINPDLFGLGGAGWSRLLPAWMRLPELPTVRG
jgi:hypothetical protein